MGVFIKQNNQLVPVNLSVKYEKINANLHFSSTTAPSDTSKLWIKTDTIPSKVIMNGEIVAEPYSVELFSDNTSPAPYSNSASVLVGNILYIIGGYSGSAKNTIYTFNISTKTLTLLGNLEFTCYNAQAVYCDGYIYLFGGVRNGSASTAISKLNISNNTVTTLQIQIPFGAYDASYVRVGTNIYMWAHGGYMYKLDTTSDTIEQVSTSAPYGKEPGIVVVGTKIYTFGGYSNSSSGYSTSYYNGAYSYDTETNTLTYLNTLPVRTRHPLCALIGNDIFIVGGLGYKTSGESSSSATNRKFIAKFNILTNESVLLDEQISQPLGIYNPYFRTSDNTYLTIYNGYLYELTFKMYLTHNHLKLFEQGTKPFNVANYENLEIKIYPRAVYLGDSNGEAQKIDSALYDSTNNAWINI